MRGLFNFIVSPDGERYNNSVKVGDKDLILNTEVYNHQFVNREAIVKSVPKEPIAKANSVSSVKAFKLKTKVPTLSILKLVSDSVPLGFLK